MVIDNVHIYGTGNSVVASGYPFRIDLPSFVFSETPNDLKRANKLAKLKDGHDVFLQGIIVQFDLTCSIKMWTQLQRYHFIDFVSSQSTMHMITKMNLADSYVEYVDAKVIEVMKKLQNEFRKNPTEENFLRLVYTNPVGMNLTARLTTNLRQLKTIYRQRKRHKLKEWKSFCKWISSLTILGLDWLSDEDLIDDKD